MGNSDIFYINCPTSNEKNNSITFKYEDSIDLNEDIIVNISEAA